MHGLPIALVVVAVLVLLGLALSVRIVQQFEKGLLFRLGRVVGVREPGLRLIVPLVEVLRRVSLRIVTMPMRPQPWGPCRWLPAPPMPRPHSLSERRP
jgi:regulator of protease activity HflC (stomatin/prohibitin superfamily)